MGGVRPNAKENGQISPPRQPFGLPDAAGGTLTSRLPCSKARNTGTFTPDRESSGESRVIGSIGAFGVLWVGVQVVKLFFAVAR